MKPSLGQSQVSNLQRIRPKNNFIKCQSALLYNSTVAKTRSITDLQHTASSKLIAAAKTSYINIITTNVIYKCKKYYLRVYPSQELGYPNSKIIAVIQRQTQYSSKFCLLLDITAPKNLNDLRVQSFYTSNRYKRALRVPSPSTHYSTA